MKKTTATIAEAVEDILLRYISEHRLIAGDKLPSEQQLAEQLGISRHSLREGLSRLRAMNFVSANKRGGTTVSRPTLFSGLTLLEKYQLFTFGCALNLMRLRVCMELGAAKYIFRNAGPSDLLELRTIALAKPQTRPEFYEAHVAFHQRMFRIGGGAITDDFNRLLNYAFRMVDIEPESTALSPEGFEAEMRSHLAFCDELAHGTVTGFTQLLSRHLAAYDDLFDPQGDTTRRYQLADPRLIDASEVGKE